MKTKLNIFLIAFCLILFCFTGNVNAAEVISVQDFIDNYLPEKLAEFEDKPYKGYLVMETSTSVNGTTYPIYRVLVYYSNFSDVGSIQPKVFKHSADGRYNIEFPVSDNKYYYVTFNFNTYENKWVTNSTFVVEHESIYNHTEFDILHKSTITLYNKDDNTPFFLVTPTVEKLEEVTLVQLEEKITGTMGTITIVAVFCLALLISLPLFWKALFRFLN